jgi:hypothetical protein
MIEVAVNDAELREAELLMGCRAGQGCGSAHTERFYRTSWNAALSLLPPTLHAISNSL